jgi:hypothetical protein
MIKNKTVSVKLPGELIVHMTNGRGIWSLLDYLIWGERIGKVQKSGGWWKLGERSLGQGIDSAMSKLEEDDDLTNELRSSVDAYLVKTWKNEP